MVRIISDTSTLYSVSQALDSGFEVSPLSVTIGGNSYKEFEEINSERFLELIDQGHMPISSQPAIGDVAALFESYPDDEVINITMADGLSGTWQAATAAAALCEHKNRITVINSRTLCGPQRHMVEEAVRMAKEGLARTEIVSHVEKLVDSAKSFLIPSDFGYLRRGGRLSPLVSYVGQTIRLVPIMTQTADGRQLVVAGVKRSFAHALDLIEKQLRSHGVGENSRIYISHADASHLAQQAYKKMREAFPEIDIQIFPLSPAFITQGGPGCVAIQTVQG